MRERANETMKYFGIENQIKKFNEESFELIEVLVKLNHIKSVEEHEELRKELVGELADVMFLMLQFIDYFRIKDMDLIETLVHKSIRTIDRIKEGYYVKELK